MSPRSLFNIILKVVGIFFIKDLLMEVANLLPALLFLRKGDFDEMGLYNIGIIVSGFSFYFLIIYILIFKTNWLINRLKLDQNFQQAEPNLNIHRSVVLSIAIIVLGALIIIDAIPLLVMQVINFIRMKKENVPNTKIDYVVLHSAKLLIGIFLIAYQRTLVNLIEYKQRRNKSGNQETNE